MKQKKIINALENVEDRYIDEMNGMGTVKSSGKRITRLLLVAAAVSCLIAVLLMGSSYLRIYEATCELDDYPLMDPAQVPPENIILEAATVTPVNMRINCRVEGVKDGEDAIYIIPGGPFTIDRKTEDGWEPLTPRMEIPRWRQERMLTGGTTDWPVDWSAMYGILPPGTYRYNCVVLEGKAPSSAEFKIRSAPPEEFVKLLEDVFNSQSYHVRCTTTSYMEGDTSHLSGEDLESLQSQVSDDTRDYWKYGDDILHTTYFGEKRAGGSMLKNGKTYYLDFEGMDSRNPELGWSLWLDLDVNRQTYWYSELYDFCRDKEITYTDDGKITFTKQWKWRKEYYGVTEIMTSVWEIDIDCPGEAAAAIARENINVPRSFDWELEKANLTGEPVTFVNTTAQAVTTAPEAVERALAECTVDYNKVIVYHDEKAGMWKVEFQIFYGYQGYQYVYMNDNGITQLVTMGEPTPK